MKIGIVRLSSLGDILHTLPLAAQLKKNLSPCHITWVVEEEFAPIVSLCREVDEVITIPLKKWGSQWSLPRAWPETWKAFWRLKKKLKSLNLDVTIDPQGLLKSGIVVRCLQAPKRIGFASDNSREFNFLFHNIKVSAKKEINIVRKNYLLLAPLSVPIPGAKEVVQPNFNIPQEAQKKIQAFLMPLKLNKVVLVNPWSAVELKQLPFAQLKNLCEYFYEENQSKPILMFGPKEEQKAKVWARSCPVHLAPKTTLTQAVALIDQCHYYVGGDTGPTYLAAFLNKPTTALFGPTNAKRQMPHLAHVKARYSSYQCPTIKPDPIITPYRCTIRNCPNNLCMQAFKFGEDLEVFHSRP